MSKIEKKYIYSLLGVTFLLYLIWSIIIPFDKAPDEFQRFDVVNFIYKYHTLPIAGDPRLVYGPYGVTYASTPYLPYIISAILSILIKGIGVGTQVYIIARLLSVLSGVGTVYFSFLIGRKLFKDSHLKYVFPAILAFIPEFTFVNSYVNQDAFMIFLSSITIYLWFEGIERNWEYKTVIKVGLVSGLILLSYLNGYLMILSTLIIVLITYNYKDKKFINKLFLCLIVMIFVSAWWFIRNSILYNGDFLGLTHTRILAEKLAIPELKPSLRNTLNKQGIGYTAIIFKTNWLISSFQSYWAVFGYMDVVLPSQYYFGILIINILSFMGLSYLIINNFKSRLISKKDNYIYFTLILISIMSIILSLYYSIYNDYQPQGRYLYPGLISFVILLIKGIDVIVPKKYSKYIYSTIVFLSIGINLYSIFNLLFIRYYG